MVIESNTTNETEESNTTNKSNESNESNYTYANTTTFTATSTTSTTKTTTSYIKNVYWQSISIGADYSLGVTTDGTGWKWGIPMSEREKAIIYPGTIFKYVAAGYTHSCSVTREGETYCWGRNHEGQSDPPRGVYFEQLSLGEGHTCGLTDRQEVLCWGDGSYRRLEIPTYVTKWLQVSVGAFSTCALSALGKILCWGHEGFNRLEVPYWNEGNILWEAVSCGSRHCCGMLTRRAVRIKDFREEDNVVCWGDNQLQQLEVPGAGLGRKGVQERFKQIDAGHLHTCGLTEGGRVWCWGDVYLWGIVAGIPIGENITQVYSGGQHSCAMTADLRGLCWGDNRWHQIEVPVDDRTLPPAILDYEIHPMDIWAYAPLRRITRFDDAWPEPHHTYQWIHMACFIPEPAEAGTPALVFTQWAGTEDIYSPHIVHFPSPRYDIPGSWEVNISAFDLRKWHDQRWGFNTIVASVTSTVVRGYTEHRLVDGGRYRVDLTYEDTTDHNASNHTIEAYDVEYDLVTLPPIIYLPKSGRTKQGLWIEYELLEPMEELDMFMIFTGSAVEGELARDDSSPHEIQLRPVTMRQGNHTIELHLRDTETNIYFERHPNVSRTFQAGFQSPYRELTDGARYTFQIRAIDRFNNPPAVVEVPNLDYFIDLFTEPIQVIRPTQLVNPLIIEYIIPESVDAGTVRVDFIWLQNKPDEPLAQPDKQSPHRFWVRPESERWGRNVVMKFGTADLFKDVDDLDGVRAQPDVSRFESKGTPVISYLQPWSQYRIQFSYLDRYRNPRVYTNLTLWTNFTEPETPHAPTLIVATASTLKIAWRRQGTGGARILEYDLELQEEPLQLSDPESVPEASFPLDFLSRTVQGQKTNITTFVALRSARHFKVRVRARNVLGSSAWSEWVLMRTKSICGDGRVYDGEECDDGNLLEDDGCSTLCKIEFGWECSTTLLDDPSTCEPGGMDGIRVGDEECDDCNNIAGDGCSPDAKIEFFWDCEYMGNAGIPITCSDGGITYTSDRCYIVCGDGLKHMLEECDDGNELSGDGCNSECIIEPGYNCTSYYPNMLLSVCDGLCGDGIRRGSETCDDGNNVPNDGCTNCQVDLGYICERKNVTVVSGPNVTVEAREVCARTCFNGEIDDDEECDDANVVDFDGCTKCKIDPGWRCELINFRADGTPGSYCVPLCGDGFRITDGPLAEGCDDGNNVALDGCSPDCTVEPGYDCQRVVRNGTLREDVCTPICGDGLTVGNEGCDDGNTDRRDGCGQDCQEERGKSCRPGDLGQPSVCVVTCGDGEVVFGQEACDDGNVFPNDGCSPTCTVETGWVCPLRDGARISNCAPKCGDGMLIYPEECDDGGVSSGDGCSAECRTEDGFVCPPEGRCTPICGDAIRIEGEDCDDGNVLYGDGCDSSCTIEPFWECRSYVLSLTSTTSVCKPACGDGFVIGSEECDDGNNANGDGCDNVCRVEVDYVCCQERLAGPSVCTLNGDECPVSSCGNGVRDPGEECDDGNTACCDGCSRYCAIEEGWECENFGRPEVPDICLPVCGDGFFVTGEECDDANEDASDGCGSNCRIETGFNCTRIHRGSVCVSTCGDGRKNVGEECDDGNFNNFDGCNRNCRVERGFRCRGGSLLTTDICEPICGDGIRISWNYSATLSDSVTEECDTGSRLDPGCDPITCRLTWGYTCELIPGLPEEVCRPVCGDGNLTTPVEECDDGNNVSGDGCGPTCEVEALWTCSYSVLLQRSVCEILCGDGRRHSSEACDDGNNYNSDGCSRNCQQEVGDGGYECLGGTNSLSSYCKPVCGDGIQVFGEDCDDGNLIASDGCDVTCQIEPMYFCTRAPKPYEYVGSLSRCYRTCGDGIIEDREECDDVVVPDPQGILNRLLPEFGGSSPFLYQRCEHCRLVPGRMCGDGLRGNNGTGVFDLVGDEECDDGNNLNGDGCDAFCRIEPGWRCEVAPVYYEQAFGDSCSTVCGDGMLIPGQEECDDGNLVSGDGCNGACKIEPFNFCFSNVSTPMSDINGSHCVDTRPPMLIRAVMDGTYARMHLYFSLDVAPIDKTGAPSTEFAEVTFNCTLLLDYASTVRDMGASPKCSWLTPRQVLVEFGVDPFTVPGDIIAVNGGVLRRYIFATDTAEAHGVRADADFTIILEPRAIITGPQMTSSCVRVTYIDSSYSEGHAGRALDIRWGVRAAMSVETHQYNATESGRLAYAVSKREREVTILFPRPGFIEDEIDFFVDRTLKPGYVYYLTLQVTNVMGLVDSTLHVIYTVQNPVPLVTSAVGRTYRQVPAFRWAVMAIDVDFPPECFDDGVFAVAGRYETSWVHSLAAPGTPYMNVNAQLGSTTSVLALRPGTLLPGRHSILSVTCVNVTERICYDPQACNLTNASHYYFVQSETCASLSFKVGQEGLCGRVIGCPDASTARRLSDGLGEDGEDAQVPEGLPLAGRSLSAGAADPDLVNALEGATLELVGFPLGGDYVPGAIEVPEEDSPLMELIRTAHEPTLNAEYLLRAQQLFGGLPLDPNRTVVLGAVVRPRAGAAPAQQAALAWLRPRATWRVAGTRIDAPIIQADPTPGTQELGGSFLLIPPGQMSFGAQIDVSANVLFDASLDSAECEIVGQLSASTTLPVNAGPTAGLMELQRMPLGALVYMQFTMKQWASSSYPIQYRFEFSENDAPGRRLLGDWNYAFRQRAFLLPRYNKTLVFYGGARDFTGSVSTTSSGPRYLTTGVSREVLLLSEYREGAMTFENYNQDTVTRLLSEVLSAATPYGPQAKLQVLQDVIYRALGMRFDSTVRNCTYDCGLHGACPASFFRTWQESVPIYEPASTTTTPVPNASANAANGSANAANASAAPVQLVQVGVVEVLRRQALENLTRCECEPGWIGLRCERSQVEADAQVALTKRVVAAFRQLIAGTSTSLGLDVALGRETLDWYLGILLRVAEDCRRTSLDALEGIAVEAVNLMTKAKRAAINRAADVATRLLDQIYQCLPAEERPEEPLNIMPSPQTVLDTLGASSTCRTLNGTQTRLCYDLATSVVDLECPLAEVAPIVVHSSIWAVNASRAGNRSGSNATGGSGSGQSTANVRTQHCRADLELGLSEPYPCPCPVPKQLFLGYGRSEGQAPLWETLAVRDEHAIVWRTIAQIFWNHSALAEANGTGTPPGLGLSAAAWFAMTEQAQNETLSQQIQEERIQQKKRNTVQAIRLAGELLGDALALEMVPGQSKTDIVTEAVSSVAEVPVTTATTRNESGTLRPVSTASLKVGEKVMVELDFDRSDYQNMTRITGNASNVTVLPPPIYAPMGAVLWRGIGGVFSWLDGSIPVRSNVVQLRLFGSGGSAVKGTKGFSRARHRFLVESRPLSGMCLLARPPTHLLDRCCAYQHTTWRTPPPAICPAPTPPPPPAATPAPAPPPPPTPGPDTSLLTRFGNAPASMVEISGDLLPFVAYFDGILSNLTLWAPEDAPVVIATRRLRIQGGDLRFGRICSLSGSPRAIVMEGDVLQLPTPSMLTCEDVLRTTQQVAAATAGLSWRTDIMDLLEAATTVLQEEKLAGGPRTSTTTTATTLTRTTTTISTATATTSTLTRTHTTLTTTTTTMTTITMTTATISTSTTGTSTYSSTATTAAYSNISNTSTRTTSTISTTSRTTTSATSTTTTSRTSTMTTSTNTTSTTTTLTTGNTTTTSTSVTETSTTVTITSTTATSTRTETATSTTVTVTVTTTLSTVTQTQTDTTTTTETSTTTSVTMANTTTATTSTVTSTTSTSTGWCSNASAETDVWCPQGYEKTQRPVYADVILEDPVGLVVLSLTGAQMSFADGSAAIGIVEKNITGVVTDYSAYYLFLLHSMLRPPGGPPGSGRWFTNMKLMHSLPRYDSVMREFLAFRPTTTTTTTETQTSRTTTTFTTTSSTTVTVTSPSVRTPPAVLLHFLESAVDDYLDIVVEAASGGLGNPMPVPARALAVEPFSVRAALAAGELDLWSEATITAGDYSPVLAGLGACAETVDMQEARPLEELLLALDSAVPEEWNESYWAQYPGGYGYAAAQAALAAAGNQTVEQPCVVVSVLGQPLRVTVVSARGLRDADSMPGAGHSDPYVVAEVLGKPLTRFTTETMQSTADPVWNHEHLMDSSSTSDVLTFKVYDGDPMKGDDLLGNARLLPSDYLPRGFDGEVALEDARANAFLKVKVELTTGARDVECLPPPECTFDVVREFECVSWSVPLMRWVPALGCKIAEGFRDDWIPDSGLVEVVCECEEGAIHSAIAIATRRPDLPPKPDRLVVISHQFSVEWYTKMHRYNLRGLFLAAFLYFVAVVHISCACCAELRWRSRARRVHSRSERSHEVRKRQMRAVQKQEEFRRERMKELRQWMPEVPRGNFASMFGEAFTSLATQARSSVLALTSGPAPGTEVALFSAKSLDHIDQGRGNEHRSLGRMNNELTGWEPFRAGVRLRRNADGTLNDGANQVAFVTGQPLKITIFGAKSLRAADWLPFSGTSDPYCVCEVLGKPEATFQTEVIDNTLNPEWNCETEIENFNVDDVLVFTVYDKDFGKADDVLGKAVLQGVQFLPGGFEGEVPLTETKGAPAVLELRIIPGTPVVNDSVELDDKEKAYMVRMIKQRVPFEKIARLLGITLKQVQDVAATVKDPNRNDGPVLLDKYMRERCPLLKRLLKAILRASPSNVWRACQNHHKFVQLTLDSQRWVFSAPERVAVFHMSLWWTATWQAVCFQMDMHFQPEWDPVCPSYGRLTLDCLTYSNALWMTFLSSVLATLFSNMTMVLARGRSFNARTKLIMDDDREEAFLRHFLGPFPMVWGALDEVKARLWNWYVHAHALFSCCCCCLCVCCRRPKLVRLGPLHWLPSLVPGLLLFMAFLATWHVTRTMFFFTSSHYMHEVTYSQPPGLVEVVVPPAEQAELRAAEEAWRDDYLDPWRIFIPQMQRFVVLFVISCIFQMLVLDPLVLAIHLILGEPTLDEVWTVTGEPVSQVLWILFGRCYMIIFPPPRVVKRKLVIKDPADIAFENDDVTTLRRIAVEKGLLLRVVKNMTMEELYEWIKHPELFEEPPSPTTAATSPAATPAASASPAATSAAASPAGAAAAGAAPAPVMPDD